MSYTKAILKLLDELHEILPPSKGNYRSLGNIPKQTFYKSLNRLEARDLIKRKKKPNNQTFFVLTEKGKKLISKPSQKTRRVDGYSTLVIFDIPEDKRRARDIFRRYLLKNGFTLLQKSVLITGNKPMPEMFELSRELKISAFVTTLSGRIDHLKI